MKKITIALVGLLAAGGLYAADVTQTSASIDTFINDLDFKDEVIEVVNELVADMTGVVASANAGESFTNTVAAAVTNLSITVSNGKVTAITINGSTTPAE